MHVLVYGFSGKVLGGIETFVLNMNEHMSADTVFDYIIDGEECVYRERIERRGGRLFFVPGVKKNPMKYACKFKRILKEQKASGTKILYIQLFSMANMLPAFLAKKVGYKVVLHAHNSGLQSKSRTYELIHLIGKRLTKKGYFFRFTNSRMSSDFMFGKGVKSEVIYNAIDLQKFAFCQEIRTRVRKNNGAENKVVIGFVGRFTTPKNPIYMLRVYSELTRIISNCELWIVGEGEMKSAMENEVIKLGIGDSIKWLGRRNDVNELMMGMDLLLQPSVFEGLGIALVEAQATGLPVVASADVIPPEAAATSHINFVSLQENPLYWASVCVRQIQDKRQSSREKNAENFPVSFDIIKEAKRLENLLVSIHNF